MLAAFARHFPQIPENMIQAAIDDNNVHLDLYKSWILKFNHLQHENLSFLLPPHAHFETNMGYRSSLLFTL